MRRVYIAGPYTQGDTAINVRTALGAAQELLLAGWAPYVPHLTHFWHLVYPGPYEHWAALGIVWLEVADALVRLPGESPGADREVAFARDHGIPVYDSVAALILGSP